LHYFSIDTHERKVIPFILAAIAIALTALFQKIGTVFFGQVPQWVTPPSAFAIYGLFYTAFEHYLWKSKYLHLLGLVKAPIIQGDWMATMSSSLDDYKKEFVTPIYISQTWTRIHIFLEGNDAFSHSKNASIELMGSSRISFIYVYQSEKKPEFSNSEYMHFGTCRLIGNINHEGKAAHFDGSYYTDKSRNSYGSLKLERKN